LAGSRDLPWNAGQCSQAPAPLWVFTGCMAVRMKHHLGSVTQVLRFEPVPYRVRAWLGDALAVDTTVARVVWEPRRVVPVFGVPAEDVRGELRRTDPQPPAPDLAGLPPMLGPTGFGTHTIPGEVVDLVVSGHILDAAGFRPDDPDLDGVVLVDFDAFTTWRTEDQLLVGHAHDPFKRIDVMASGRQVEVRLGDVILASSKRALALWETHLPVRWYLPHDDVRMDLLEPSDHRTTCAYKGHATYLSIRGGERDIAWQYVEPLNDAARVSGYVCFWNERTDLFLDGLEIPRPATPWSPAEEVATAEPDRLEFG
jgi:uncharacterized protein (DUF427 family)